MKIANKRTKDNYALKEEKEKNISPKLRKSSLLIKEKLTGS